MNLENKKATRQSYGEALLELGKENENIVVLDADLSTATKTDLFAKEFPDRFFDIGIAEQHALGLAAGMAKDGVIPVVPIYSSFYQRAYDQVIHDIALQNLQVVMCVDRAGIVGADGETHQGQFDMSFFRLVPNLTIMAPKNFKELEDMLEFAVTLNKPVVIRYPRGGEGKEKIEQEEKIELGKAEILKQGNDITILAIGKTVERAQAVSNMLKEKDIDAEVINARFLKPLDKETIKTSIEANVASYGNSFTGTEKTKRIITIEDGTIINGLGTAVKELIIDENLENIEIKSYAYPDNFIQHGTVDELEKLYGQDVQNIVKDILNSNYVLNA